MRAIRPTLGSARASVGRIRYLRPPCPVGGNHLSCAEKININIRPSQKPAIDTPSKATTMVDQSRNLLWLSAATMPRGKASR